MKVVALISGGKDSTFNIMKCIENGHEVIALANLYPVDTQELDSFMYQSVGSDVIELIGQCYGLPLYRRPISGKPLNQDLSYNPTDGDEVEDLYELLKQILTTHPDIQGVSSGAIFSTYQKNRVEEICSRLGLSSLAYLWHREQVGLLDEMISSNINAVLIKIAAYGLCEKHLGKSISELRNEIVSLSKKYQLNPCGEGGEYESLTLDCPLYKCGKLKLVSSKVVIHSDKASAHVVYLIPTVEYIPKQV